MHYVFRSDVVWPSFSAEENQRNIARIESLPARLRERVITSTQSNSERRTARMAGRSGRLYIIWSTAILTRSTLQACIDRSESDDALWAELQDGKELDIEVSLTLLEALHMRWTTVL